MFMSSNDMAKEQKSLCCRAQDACLYGRFAWTISLQFLLVEQLALVFLTWTLRACMRLRLFIEENEELVH